MKQELFELDGAISLATLRAEKMDWLIGHLLNSSKIKDDDMTVVSLLGDMIDLVKADLQNIDTATDKLREQAFEQSKNSQPSLKAA